MPNQTFQGQLDPIQHGELCFISRTSKESGNNSGAWIVGPVFGGVGYHVAKANQANELASFRNRVVKERPDPQEEAWDEVMMLAPRVLPQARVRPQSFAEWVNHFPGAKRQCLIREYERMHGCIPPKRELKRYNCFVKREIKLAYLAYVLQKEISPRNIMSAKDSVKVLLGPYFRAFSKYCHATMSHECALYYEPGGLANEVTYWLMQRPEWPIIENDFSRFDCTNSIFSTRLKIWFAKRLGLTGESLRIYELLLERSKFSSRHGVSCVRVPGTLSGHPDTTWSNTMINLTVQWYCIAKVWQKKYHPEFTFSQCLQCPDFPSPGASFRLAACGDDSIGRVCPALLDVSTMVAAGETLGFKMKFKANHPLQDARFCSNAFYPTKDGYLMAPTMKCVLKLGATLSNAGPAGDDAHRQHMRGVALGLLKQVNHVPLLNDYIQMVLRTTAGSKGKYLNEARREAEIKYRGVDAACEESDRSEFYIEQMYRLPCGIVRALRQQIAQMSAPGIYSTTDSDIFVAAVGHVEDLG